MNKTYKLIIIGGGPAGIMSAISASIFKCRSISLLEKNNSLGKKLLLTGSGRCNFTNSADLNNLTKAFEDENYFYRNVFRSFSNYDLINFFKSIKIYSVEEDNGRFFPLEGGAGLVLENLQNKLEDSGIEIIYKSSVKEIFFANNIFKISCAGNKSFYSYSLIIATGGLSYPQTGSTGDGYFFAEKLGHKIIKPYPSLAPLFSDEKFSSDLQGLSLRDISISVFKSDSPEKKYLAKGDIIFTHCGISGPAALDISKKAFEILSEGGDAYALIDMFSGLSLDMLYDNFLSFKNKNRLKEFKSFFKALKIPEKMIDYIFNLGLKTEVKKIANISKADFFNKALLFKEFKVKITAVEDFMKAMATSGGIALNEINSKTMQSKLIPGLFFAGEIIEKSGPTGGYNLQKAFSTGYIAGKSAALKTL